MKEIRNKVLVLIFLPIICLLASCTSYTHCIYFKVTPDNNSTIQVDVVGVSDSEYKELKEIGFDMYWKYAFVDNNFPEDKASLFFDKNSPKHQKLVITSELLEKWKSKDAEYLMIFACLPIASKTKEKSIQKLGEWKVAIPLEDIDWLWLDDTDLFVDILSNKMEIH